MDPIRGEPAVKLRLPWRDVTFGQYMHQRAKTQCDRKTHRQSSHSYPARQSGSLSLLRRISRDSEEDANPTAAALRCLHPFVGHWYLDPRTASHPQKVDVVFQEHLENR
ncbi:hypothetical protein T265_05207 [Opisthorchis viverrini]|uniref:Uncharacterized protein n=1 Tax=Opisthorchis viverrini TaxID=6198 RepID=A0A075AFK6_OPIVI|nr:hypothetical protein T265_05207 [Opisthorchis viverrini]KER27854.1 hypothetical protein T265_05207 [Opisthorchis viverrini]